MQLRTRLTAITTLLLLLASPGIAEDRLFGDKAPELPVKKNQKDSGSVNTLKKKYWTQGENQELSVVQNRIYRKKNRLELGLIAGSLSSDPFLSVKSVGGRLGYYFTETFAIEVIAWKAFSSNSSTFDALQQNQGLTVKTNPPKAFYGGGINYVPLYGKLSLFGDAILHFDFGFTAGAGMTSTSTGSYVTPYIGLNQRLYITSVVSLTFDYKLMYYGENAPLNVSGGGNATAPRDNWTNAALLGVGFLF